MALRVGAQWQLGRSTTGTLSFTDANAGFSSDVKACILLQNNAVSLESNASQVSYCIGAAANNGGTTQASILGNGTDNSGTSGETTDSRPDKVMTGGTPAGEVVTISSWDSAGITLNYSSADFARGVTALMFGGDIQANILEFDWSAASGNKVAAHGLTRTPELLFFYGVNKVANPGGFAGNGMQLGFWAGSATSGYGVNYGTGNTAQTISATASSSLIPNLSGSTNYTVGTVDSTNVNVSASASNSAALYCLAIAGLVSPLRAATGWFTTPTSTGNVASISGIGFRPQVVLHLLTRRTALSNATDDSAGLIGFGYALTNTGTRQGYFGSVGDQGAGSTGSPTLTYRRDRASTTYAIGVPAVSNTTPNAQASVTSFDFGGMTYNYATVSASAFEIGYLAFAQVPVVGFAGLQIIEQGVATERLGGALQD